MKTKNTKMLVLGGGFAGVETAIKLRKQGYEVTLVSNRDYLFIYPISIWIPVDRLSFKSAQLSLFKLKEKHGFDLIIDEVKQIQPKELKVETTQYILNFEYLFIAMGMSKVYTPGLDHTHSICGAPMESIEIKKILRKIVDRGYGEIAVGFGANPGDPTATAVRGGPAFELLFNISHHIKKKGLRESVGLHFFAPMKAPGKKLGELPYKHLNAFYKRYSINTHIGKKIKQFEATQIVFDDDSILKNDLTIFISGGAGHKVLKNTCLPLSDAGFIRIESTCQVVGYENIYAIGDIAEIIGPDWSAKQGHVAEVMAHVAAFNVHQSISGKTKRIGYQDKLDIVCIMDSGDGAAYISRNHKGGKIVLLPFVGHWLKKAWGFYFIQTKLKRLPRLPGL